MSHRGVSAWETEGIDNSQHSLEALVRLAPLAIIEVDLEGKIKNWNPAAEQMFGWTENEVLGRVNPLILSEYRAEYETGLLDVLHGSTIRGKEVRRQHKNGRRLDMKLWAAPIHVQGNEITGVTAFLEDITDQKETEWRLRESLAREEKVKTELQRNEERMRLAFEAAKVGFWDWNIVTGDTLWSPEASRQMGLPEDSPTSFAIFMNAVHPDDRKMMQEGHGACCSRQCGRREGISCAVAGRQSALAVCKGARYL